MTRTITINNGNKTGRFPFGGEALLANNSAPRNFHGTLVFDFPDGLLFCKREDGQVYWSMAFWKGREGDFSVDFSDAAEKRSGPEPAVAVNIVDLLGLFAHDGILSSGVKSYPVKLGPSGADVRIGSSTLEIRDGEIKTPDSITQPRYVFDNFRLEIGGAGDIASLVWDYRPVSKVMRVVNGSPRDRIIFGDSLFELLPGGEASVLKEGASGVVPLHDPAKDSWSFAVPPQKGAMAVGVSGESEFSAIYGDGVLKDIVKKAPRGKRGEFETASSIEPEFRLDNRRGQKRDGVTSFDLPEGVLKIRRLQGKRYSWEFESEKGLPVPDVELDLAGFNGKVAKLDIPGKPEKAPELVLE